MNVRNCRRCKRLFNYFVGPYICPSCREEMEAKFQEVKKYIQEHAFADVPTVSKECNIDSMQIRQWVKEERLCFADDSPIGIPCELCGATIKSGRYCPGCKNEMTSGLKNAIKKPEVQPARSRDTSKINPKMRYFE